MLVALLFGLFGVTQASSLIGYDCSDPKAEYSVVNLREVEPCVTDSHSIKKDTQKIQVLQTRLYRPVHVHGCRIKITRLAYNCGWQSYLSPKPDMLYSGIKEIGMTACKEIHVSGTYRSSDLVIRDIKPNSTHTGSTVLAGSIDARSNCQPVAKYQDAGGVLENVVVAGQTEITIFDFTATAMMGENKLIIASLGISCPLQTGYCQDHIHGEIYWTYQDESDCRGTSIDILYEGEGEIITLNTRGRVLAVTSDNSVFALRVLEPTRLCNQDVWKTEHGRVYISPEGSLGYKFSRSGDNIYALNVDLTSYINSKFLYTSIASFQSTQALVAAIALKECETRRMVLENRLILAKQSPDMVSMVTQGMGVYGRLLGEVMYIIKCVPVGVMFRSPPSCYQEIPVEYKNRSMYLSPITRLLISDGNEVPCKSLLNPRFLIGLKWYIRTPELIETQAPKMLDPNSKISWEYEPFVQISAGGLYSKEQMRSLQDEMMFPAVREAYTTKVVRRMTNTGGMDADMTTLFNPSELNSLSAIIAGKISWFFKVFGHYASIIIGLYMAWKFVIYIIGVLTNCIIIKKSGKGGKAYLASLIDSFTSLITVHQTSAASKILLRKSKPPVVDSPLEPSAPEPVPQTRKFLRTTYHPTSGFDGPI